MTLVVKNLPLHSPDMQKMEETQVWSLSVEDPLEEEMATHSSILVGRIQQTEEPGQLQSMRLQRVRHNWASEHSGIIILLRWKYDFPNILFFFLFLPVKYQNAENFSILRDY